MIDLIFAQAVPTPEPAGIAIWIVAGAAALAFGIWRMRRK